MDTITRDVYRQAMMLAVTGVCGAGFFKDDLAGIDIKAEYALIKQKKSRLSANMRALVVRRVERGQPDEETNR